MNKTIRTIVASLLALASFAPATQATPVVGRLQTAERIEAHSTQEYTVWHRGGELTSIIVDGDRDTDLDLYVLDPNGDLVACDTDRTDYCVVSFFVPRTGQYTLRIANLGPVYNNCVITAD